MVTVLVNAADRPHLCERVEAEAEVLDVRDDKPICTLRTTITNQDGTVVLDGTALVYRDPLVAGTDPT